MFEYPRDTIWGGGRNLQIHEKFRVYRNTDLICLWSSCSCGRTDFFQSPLVCKETDQLRLNIDQDVDSERKISRIVSHKRVDQTNTKPFRVFEGVCSLNFTNRTIFVKIVLQIDCWQHLIQSVIVYNEGSYITDCISQILKFTDILWEFSNQKLNTPLWVW